MVLGSDHFLCRRPCDLFYLQSGCQPYAVLVLHRVDRAALRLYIYPNRDFFFPVEEAACIFCFNLPVDLPAFVHLRDLHP